MAAARWADEAANTLNSRTAPKLWIAQGSDTKVVLAWAAALLLPGGSAPGRGEQGGAVLRVVVKGKRHDGGARRAVCGRRGDVQRPGDG